MLRIRIVAGGTTCMYQPTGTIFTLHRGGGGGSLLSDLNSDWFRTWIFGEMDHLRAGTKLVLRPISHQAASDPPCVPLAGFNQECRRRGWPTVPHMKYMYAWCARTVPVSLSRESHEAAPLSITAWFCWVSRRMPHHRCSFSEFVSILREQTGWRESFAPNSNTWGPAREHLNVSSCSTAVVNCFVKCEKCICRWSRFNPKNVGNIESWLRPVVAN